MALSAQKGSLILAILLYAISGSVGALAETIVTNNTQTTELWEGKALTARFRVGICYQKNGRAQGVLLLRHSNGQEDVYHLYGTLHGNEFDLSHSSGHSFKGTLTGDDTMQGKARLKSGLSFTLSGNRWQNVPLAAPDCAPLPR